MAINTKANKVARPPADFEEKLNQQLGYLRRSCAAFDSGAFDEAIRIALIIRVLLHDTTKSVSLFTHLKIKDKLSYVDTGIYRHLYDPAIQAYMDEIAPGNKISATAATDVGLVETGDEGDGRFGWYAPLKIQRTVKSIAHFKAMRGTAGFAEWWKDPLVETNSQKSFSRSDLVLIMANQDGGGHVDAGLDMDYRALSIDPMAWAAYSSEPISFDADMPDVRHNVAFASVRQIAFELDMTIQRYRYAQDNPGLFALADPFAGIVVPEPPHVPRGLGGPLLMMSSAIE